MGRARRDAPGPLRGPGAARRGRSPTRSPAATPRRGSTRASRPPYVEAVATARAMALRPLRPTRRSTSSTSRRRRRSRRSAAAKAAGIRVTAETCPHYLVADRGPLRRPGPGALRLLRHRAAAAVGRGPRRAVGRPGRRLARPRRHRSRAGPHRHREGRGRGTASSFDRISNGAPGIETLLAIVYSAGRREGPDHPRADGRPHRDDPGPAVRPDVEGLARGRARRGHRPVRPDRPTDHPRRRPPPHERLHAVRGPRRVGRRPRSCSCGAARSSATAPSSGAAESARFVERGPIAG